MDNQASAETETEVVGLFDEAAGLRAAIDEMLLSGFRQDTLSLLSGHEAIVENLHHLPFGR